MQQIWFIARIVLVMFGIFACGIWVGRMTAPKPPPPWPRGVPAESARPDGGEHHPAPGTIAYIAEKYRIELGLDEKQAERLLPFFEETHAEIARQTSPGKRLDAVARLHEKIAPSLTPEQKAKADRLLEDARKNAPKPPARPIR